MRGVGVHAAMRRSDSGSEGTLRVGITTGHPRVLFLQTAPVPVEPAPVNPRVRAGNGSVAGSGPRTAGGPQTGPEPDS